MHSTHRGKVLPSHVHGVGQEGDSGNIEGLNERREEGQGSQSRHHQVRLLLLHGSEAYLNQIQMRRKNWAEVFLYLLHELHPIQKHIMRW